jgi:hypothetical protein
MKFFFYVVLLVNGLCAYSQTVTKINEEYDFPIKQGNKEWEQFESVEKRIEALQIPDFVLIKISTEGLLETCLAFPYLTDILFYDNYQKGFEALSAEFNGFRELLKRKDLMEVLLKKYKTLNSSLTTVRLQKSIEQGRFSFRHFVLEFMLTQDIILSKLNLEQKKHLFFLTSENKKAKSNYTDIFSDLNTLPAKLLCAKIIVDDPEFKFESDEQKKVLADFIKAPVYIEQQIIDYIENYININYK